MDDLYKIANEYYLDFESVRTLGGFKNFYLYALLMTIVLFGVCLFWFITTIDKSQGFGVFLLDIIPVFISELLMFYVLSKVKDEKQKNIMIRVGNKMGVHFRSVGEAKIHTLKKYFSCAQSDFSEISEKIASMIERASLYSHDSNSVERLFDLIYNNDARARILALFALFVSITTILLVNSGYSMETVFDSFYGADARTGIILYVFTVIIFVVLGLGVALAFHVVKRLLILATLVSLTSNESNIEAVKYLARDLNNYHLFSRTDDNKIIII